MHRTALFAIALVACNTPQEPVANDAPVPADPWTAEGGLQVSEAPTTPAGIAPIQGGGLVKIDADRVAVADVDGDRILVVNAETQQVEQTVHLAQDATPFRLAHGHGQLFATLTGSHELAAWDLDSGQLTWSTQACIEPRGVDVFDGQLFLACQGGEVVTLDPGSGAILDRNFLGFGHDDLRDVVAFDDHLFVSRFRTARVTLVERNSLQVLEEWVPPVLSNAAPIGFNLPPESALAPRVAWKMVRHPAEYGVFVLHQRHETRPINIASGGGGNADQESPYGGQTGPHCAGILHSTWTEFRLDGPQGHGPVISPGTMVDFAPNEASMSFLVGGPGPSGDGGTAFTRRLNMTNGTPGCHEGVRISTGNPGSVVSVGQAAGRSIEVTRQPFSVLVEHVPVAVEPIAEAHPDQVDGWKAFHTTAPAAISCASCHPSGLDDAHTWSFQDDQGLLVRRTPGFGGVLADTAPYHWDAEFENLDQLINEVFVRRMGAEPGQMQGDTLLTWMRTLDPPARTTAVLDPAAVARGRVLFHDPELECASCHDGATLTNNDTVQVGTGGTFQVPTLRGVGARGPWMHDGCARTLEDRFYNENCGGYSHGETADLTSDQIDDLVAYLRTL